MLIDYWSHTKLSEVESRVNTHYTKVAQQNRFMSTNEYIVRPLAQEHMLPLAHSDLLYPLTYITALEVTTTTPCITQ